MQRFNEPFPVLGFALTIQAAKAFLVAFPLLIEVLRPIMSFLDDVPSTFWRKRDMVELMYDFNGWTLLLNSKLFIDCNGKVVEPIPLSLSLLSPLSIVCFSLFSPLWG